MLKDLVTIGEFNYTCIEGYYSVDWTTGLEHWTGLLDWNTGLDYWTDIFLIFAHSMVGFMESYQ